MGYLNNDTINISPYFNGSICQLFLVKARNTLVVKTLKPAYCKLPALLDRFSNEADILQSIDNEHTPRFFKSRLDIKRPYFVYEYISGTTLAETLKQQTLALPQCIDICRQLLTSLSCLHERDNPIIHSDICPDNIIVSAQGHAYLIDFGCACKLQDAKDNAHTWIGKHAYLSPEQAQGKQWAQQSDLYQLGLVFYEMLSGDRRNSGHTSRDMLPLAAQPATLQLDDITEQYRDFISKLLAIDSSRRFQSAQQTLLELNNI